MRVEVIRGRRALPGLVEEWRALWARCPDVTPFQHPAWLLPWSHHFGGGEFLTITLRREGRLAGLAPFFILTDPAGRRELLLLGTGNTDYLDILVEPGVGTAGAEALLAAALGAAGCDRCELRQLRPGSPLLTAAQPAGWNARVMDDEPCPVLDLPPTSADLETRIRRAHLARVRRDRRRLERQGRVAITPARADELEEGFAALVRLHQARWTRRGEPGVFGDPAALAFHREVVEAFLREGWLRLLMLRFDGEIIASHYTFHCRGRLYNYLGGHDEAYSHWSPGTLALAHGIEAAIGEGARHFDFLRGRERYKYEWGAADTATYRRQLRRDDQ
jgi:CelD/BcsL family acetyltransferase involved in cellulose biosynthesis